jgi:hypothetical protein
MSLRIVIGFLYMLTGLVALYFSIQLTLTGLYGVPFSRWYAEVFVSGLILVIGAVCWWTSNRQWAAWVPLIGSALLAAYFLPAGISLVRQCMAGHGPGLAELSTRIGAILLVLTSLVISVSNRLQSTAR